MRLILLLSLCIIFSCQTNNQDSKIVKSELVLLSEKINQNPNDVNLILNRVDYNLNLKKFESALFDLNQCLSIDSLNSSCLLYTSPSPRDATLSRMPSSA